MLSKQRMVYLPEKPGYQLVYFYVLLVKRACIVINNLLFRIYT